jgi:hypothetical protein
VLCRWQSTLKGKEGSVEEIEWDCWVLLACLAFCLISFWRQGYLWFWKPLWILIWVTSPSHKNTATVKAGMLMMCWETKATRWLLMTTAHGVSGPLPLASPTPLPGSPSSQLEGGLKMMLTWSSKPPSRHLASMGALYSCSPLPRVLTCAGEHKVSIK